MSLDDAALERMRSAALAELAVKPVQAPWWRDALLLVGVNVATVLACSVVLALLGIQMRALPPGLLLGAAVPLLLSLVAGGIAAVAPGRGGRFAAFAALLGLAVGVLVLWLGTSGPIEAAAGAQSAARLGCIRAEMLITVIPAAASVFVLSRFAWSPLRMLLAGLAAGAAGLLALHLHCANGSPSHFGLSHVLPWVAAGAVTVFIRWRVRSRSYVP